MKLYALLFLLSQGLQVTGIKVLSIDVAGSHPLTNALKRREDSRYTSVTLDNLGVGTSYRGNVTIGTPPQSLILGIDTGSTDIWVLSSNISICSNVTLQNALGYGCTGGSFDAGRSSSLQVVGEEFNISYADSSGARGEYVKDDLEIGGVVVKGMQMGLGLNTTSEWGILGLGTHVAAKTPYPSFIEQLVNQSIINTKAFSLNLNSLNSSTGTLLLGGVDTAKFHGNLATLPMLSPTQYFVALSTITISNSTSTNKNETTIPLSSTATDGSTVPAIAVVLDSGASLTYLPGSTISQLYSILTVIPSTQTDTLVYTPCSHLSSPLSLTFQFLNKTGPSISVPISELVYRLDSYPIFAPGHEGVLHDLPWGEDETCIFGIRDGDALNGGGTILGATFLRSAYVVYDVENLLVGIAQADFSARDSNVVEIAKGGSFPTDSGSATSSGGVGGSSTGSPTSTGGGNGGSGNGGGNETGSPTTTSGGAASATSSGAAGVTKQVPFKSDGVAVLVFSGLCAVAGAGFIWV